MPVSIEENSRAKITQSAGALQAKPATPQTGGPTIPGLPGIPLAPNGEKIQMSIEQLESEGRNVLLEEAVGTTNKSAQDEAVLSKEAQSPQETQRVRQQKESWTIEDSPLWLLLLNWDPGAMEGTLEDKLLQLFELYQALLYEVMANSAGANQQDQLLRLDSALSMILNKLWDGNLKEMTSFLENYSTRDQLEQLKAELYKAVTGRRVTVKEIDRFWNMGKYENTGKHSQQISRGSGAWNSHPSQERQTVIYRPGNKTSRVLVGAGMDLGQKGKLTGTAQMDHSGRTERLFSEKMLSGKVPKTEITARDMGLSKQFLSYVQSENSPFLAKAAGTKEEELEGVLAAVLQIQCREFVKGSSIGNAMTRILYDAIDRYIDHCVRQEETAAFSRNSGESLREKTGGFQYKNVYKIYCNILSLYEKYRQPERAISEGVRSAVETYQERKTREQDGKEVDLRFFKLNEDNLPTALFADLRDGKLFLEKNWLKFLTYTAYRKKQSNQNVCLLPLDRSFWGMYLVPEGEKPTMTHQKYLYLFMGILVFGLIVYLIAGI